MDPESDLVLVPDLVLVLDLESGPVWISFVSSEAERYLFAVCFISSGDTKGVIFLFYPMYPGEMLPFAS